MSLIITKIIIGLVMALTIFSIVNETLKIKYKFSFKFMGVVIIIALPIIVFYRTEYNAFVSLLTYILSIMLIKKYFKISLLSSILLCSYSMLLIAIFDIIISTINSLFFTYTELRTLKNIVITNNILIGIFAYVVSKIPIIKNKINYIYRKTEKTPNYNTITFAILCVFTIIITFFNITEIFKLNAYYIITIISIFILVILYYFYITELNNYGRLSDKYEVLFDYVQTFEDWIENEQMYRHELKNNLSMIRNMTKNKKIINKIDDMLNMNINIDDEYIELLKYIPKGGLKGLLYYKIALAKNKKVKIVIEISSKVNILLKQLAEEQLRQLCIVLGIYIDNALDSAEESNKKIVTLEIYEINKMIIFTISNTYKELVPIKNMKKIGFTTKGGEHGKGLYYANKVLSKTKWLKSEQVFLNDYFIQKIYIK